MRLCRTVALIATVSLSSFGCQRSSGTGDIAGSAGNHDNSSAKLSNEKVQRAADQAVEWTRKGGGAQVVGIQEIPQENTARADIEFNGFQYNSDDSGNPVPKDRSTPRKPDLNSPNFYDELYKYNTQQVHVETYSGQGVATLKHYNDGRWVLTGVHWGFHGTNATVEVQ